MDKKSRLEKQETNRLKKGSTGDMKMQIKFQLDRIKGKYYLFSEKSLGLIGVQRSDWEISLPSPPPSPQGEGAVRSKSQEMAVNKDK